MNSPKVRRILLLAAFTAYGVATLPGPGLHFALASDPHRQPSSPGTDGADPCAVCEHLTMGQALPEATPAPVGIAAVRLVDPPDVPVAPPPTGRARSIRAPPSSLHA